MLLLFVSNNNSCNGGLNEDKLKAKREVELDVSSNHTFQTFGWKMIGKVGIASIDRGSSLLQ